MADEPSKKEFGKRRPAAGPPPPRTPVKRSGHVALLVMGTVAVGTTAYTLMPRQNCEPTPGAVPGQTTTTCTGSGSSSSGSSSRWSSRSSFFSSDSSSHSSSSTSSDSGSVSRGGFGSFGHGFSGGG